MGFHSEKPPEGARFWGSTAKKPQKAQGLGGSTAKNPFIPLRRRPRVETGAVEEQPGELIFKERISAIFLPMLVRVSCSRFVAQICSFKLLFVGCVLSAIN